MENKEKLIIDEIIRVSKKIGKDKFTRGEFLDHTDSVNRSDIEKHFGSFANSMKTAGLRPQRHHKVTNEELFMAYDKTYKIVGHYPLGHPGEQELYKVSSISGHTFRERFGGLKNFLFEYKDWLLQTTTKDKTIISKSKVVSKKIEPKVVDSFDNKQRFTGKATENLIVAELLFRGFNAQLLQVDEGIDVFALNVKNNELYLIQVKHTYYENPNRSGLISITISSFEKNKKGNVYYIFVLEREINEREFLILPFLKIDELMKNGLIERNENSKQFSFRILHKSLDDAFVGKTIDSTNVSRYLNAWDVLL